jgi:LAO/AO transport system kinase
MRTRAAIGYQQPGGVPQADSEWLTMNTLVDKIRRGDRHLLAKAMSLVDRPGPQADGLKDELRRVTGQVPWWGFTGPPGVGKSTLIDTLLSTLRERGRRIGVVAIDPTSPMSDGALLGDRVRMMRHAVDRDVFIRSLATHHREGGLSDAALHCGRLLELAAYDPVLIETVGVGQNEVDVASVADICVVLLGPGYGDDIQLIKAGLLEIAHVVVVNKCDLPGADRLLKEVRQELASSTPRHARTRKSPRLRQSKNPQGAISADEKPRTTPTIFGIEAKSGKGVDQLLEKLFELDHAARDAKRRQQRCDSRVLGEMKRSAMRLYEQSLDKALDATAAGDLVDKLRRGELSLDAVIGQLAGTALDDLRRNSDDEEET